ncbi:MAG TPA: tetratricopeptide repeat protein, partial [Candidatus Bathyarchaeia archaeon]|nr:tetratricopeptide repeat protein [Candidatus Bathyarchaeia archaeon]
MMGFRTKDQRLRTDDQRPMTKIGLWSVVCGLRSSFRSPYSLPRRQAGVLRFPRWIRLETVRFLNLECIIFFTIIFSVFLNQTGLAEDASSLFARANESYKAQRYGEAALLYDEIARQGTAGGPIFYNSGNAYFKTGELGRAIVNYERALEWMPRDA